MRQREGRSLSLFLYQLSMSFNGFFYPLRFNSDVTLRCACATVLQKALHKGNVIAVLLVYLCGVPFPKAMRADALIAQVVTDKSELLFARRALSGETSAHCGLCHCNMLMGRKPVPPSFVNSVHRAQTVDKLNQKGTVKIVPPAP